MNKIKLQIRDKNYNGVVLRIVVRKKFILVDFKKENGGLVLFQYDSELKFLLYCFNFVYLVYFII